jgi:hypothetical protein
MKARFKSGRIHSHGEPQPNPTKTARSAPVPARGGSDPLPFPLLLRLAYLESEITSPASLQPLKGAETVCLNVEATRLLGNASPKGFERLT